MVFSKDKTDFKKMLVLGTFLFIVNIASRYAWDKYLREKNTLEKGRETNNFGEVRFF